jgi:hypothetical protein
VSERVDAGRAPTRTRVIVATLIVLATVLIVWKVIDYRTQPPPPPHKVGEFPDRK